MDNEERAIQAEEAAERAAEAQQESTALIAITTLPEIKENLRSLRERWEQEAKDAAALVCTEESVQSIKTMRAEMRKEFDDADTLRKATKERYMAAWNDVEATWKECVAEPFKRADASYKATIGDFEGQLKAECRKRLESYFSELCALEKLDFLTFDMAMRIGNIKISLSDCKKNTPRQLQDALAAVTAQVATNMDRISRMQDSAEIADEYKRCFDVGKAVDIVNGRKLRIQEEREREERRRAEQERQEAAVAKVAAAATPPTVGAPVEAPVAAQRPERVFPEFRFTVYNCTRTQLIKIREFLKQEGIPYGK